MFLKFRRAYFWMRWFKKDKAKNDEAKDAKPKEPTVAAKPQDKKSLEARAKEKGPASLPLGLTKQTQTYPSEFLYVESSQNGTYKARFITGPDSIIGKSIRLSKEDLDFVCEYMPEWKDDPRIKAHKSHLKRSDYWLFGYCFSHKLPNSIVTFFEQ